METYVYGLLMSLFAGSATILGGYLGIINRKPTDKFISFMMALAAGVMLFISFVEMFSDSEIYLGMGTALLWLFVGLGVALIIDISLPEHTNVHDHVYKGKIGDDEMFYVDNQKYMKLGILTMLAIMIHNVPEGLASFSASFLDKTVGLEIAVAVALHNIPEGITVAVPIYVALRKRKTALLYATISGLAEPFGALIAWLIFGQFISQAMIHCLLSFVAGIMIYISVDTLIPTAKNMEHKHTMILGFSLGMLIMGLTLIIL